jgi:hypothetical protein
MQSENFLGPKIRYLDWYKYPKKTLFEFFSSIFRGLSTGPKGEKVDFFVDFRKKFWYLKGGINLSEIPQFLLNCEKMW